MRKFDNSTEYTFLSSNLINLYEDIQEFKNKQVELSDQQDEVIDMLVTMLKEKGIDVNQLDGFEEDDQNEDNQTERTRIN